MNRTIAREAVALKNERLAELYRLMALGACRHGHFDHGYDMEQACMACEYGEEGYSTPEQIAYQYAKSHLEYVRRTRLGEKLAILAKVHGENPAVFASYVIWTINNYQDGVEF